MDGDGLRHRGRLRRARRAGGRADAIDTSPRTSQPCLACGQPVSAPLAVCLSCGGPALYASDGSWAVEAGPIASQKFRDAALDFLGQSLVAFDRARASALLQSDRVRVTSGLSREVAEALVKRLGAREAAAQVTQGPTPRVGMAGAFRFGLPILGLGGGAAVALIASTPIGWVAGGAAAVGLGAMNAMRRQPELGTAPVAPPLPARIAEVPARLASVGPKLDPRARESLMSVARGAFAILGRLSKHGDVIAIGLGGTEGGMADAAMGLLSEAIHQAELLALAGPAESDREKHIAALGRLAESAKKAGVEMDLLGVATGGTPGEAEAKIAQEIEHMRRTAAELTRNV